MTPKYMPPIFIDKELYKINFCTLDVNAIFLHIHVSAINHAGKKSLTGMTDSIKKKVYKRIYM